ncbi:MAG: hypothetical protein NDF54_03930 [archaeon GB-1867-035]|nr:hypothetical protein [Candidatus Culexmicrobium profundum]
MQSEAIRYTSIRKIQLVIDVEDYLAPILTLKDFEKIYKTKPKPPRYRIASIEVLVCPEDGNVILPTECSKCPRFIRRVKDMILCIEKTIE